MAVDKGVERSVLDDFKDLINIPHVVVISGLRRAGKSTLLKQVADTYYKSDDYYYINFEDERLTGFNVSDFNSILETLIQYFGEKKVFFVDEIQNVSGFETFVRRLSDQGYKFYITGSNASLLSQELGTRLTGRYILITLFPFSFVEFLRFSNFEQTDVLSTIQKAKIKGLFNDYLRFGGIPDAIKYPNLSVHKNLYDIVLYRDIASRHNIENIAGIKALSLFLLSNISNPISFTKLKETLKLGSTTTVTNYIEYFQMSWLFFIVNVYDFSVKRQQIASKKVYSIDTGLVNSVAFSFSQKYADYLENMVLIELKRRGKEVYYYKVNGSEIDFYVPAENLYIQVTKEILTEDQRKRELGAFTKLAQSNTKAKFLVLTDDTDREEEYDGKKYKLLPIYKWLCEKR